MSLRIRSAAELPSSLRAQVAAIVPAKRHKYGARAIVVDGVKFQSRLEAQRYQQLKHWRESGEYIESRGRLVSFALWPTFVLPGGVIAKLDSVQVWQIGGRVNVIFEDAKGMDTRESRLKRRQIEALWGIQVQLWPER